MTANKLKLNKNTTEIILPGVLINILEHKIVLHDVLSRNYITWLFLYAIAIFVLRVTAVVHSDRFLGQSQVLGILGI
jgi:hypothetical protein